MTKTEEMALYDLPEVERLFLDGDKSLILKAVYWSAITGSPLPHWVRKAFVQAYQETVEGRHASWDDVFGRPHKKHTKLVAKNQSYRCLWRVYVAVLVSRAKGPRRDPFPEVAKQFGISERLCRKYFRQADKEARASELGRKGVPEAYGLASLESKYEYEKFLEGQGLKP